MNQDPGSLPLTATIITLNEEANIRDCLESIAWVPHIVVVDSGSTDRTVEIAREFTDSVVVTDWPGHVEQKNRAVDLAPTDWVLSLDADERCTPELRQEVERVAATLKAESPDNSAPGGFSVRRKTRYLGRWILGGGWYPDRKVRLFDRRVARWGGTNPHDHVYVENRPTVTLDADLLHHTYRDMKHHLEVIDFFTTIAAREKHRRGRGAPLLGMLTRPPIKFLKMYFFQRGYRDGFPGFVIAVLGSFYVFLKYAKLWERKQLVRRGVDPDSLPVYRRGPEYRPPRSASPPATSPQPQPTPVDPNS